MGTGKQNILLGTYNLIQDNLETLHAILHIYNVIWQIIPVIYDRDRRRSRGLCPDPGWLVWHSGAQPDLWAGSVHRGYARKYNPRSSWTHDSDSLRLRSASSVFEEKNPFPASLIELIA